MSKPTIFLDVDGVLTHFMMQHYVTDPAPNRFDVDETKLQMFADFVYEVDADVVLCSAWRGADQFASGPDAFSDYLFDRYAVDLPIAGYTTCTGLGTKRQNEIDEYVLRNQITNYVILDDAADEYIDHNRLIHVSNVDGLLMSDLIKAAQVMQIDFMNEVTGKRWSELFPDYAAQF